LGACPQSNQRDLLRRSSVNQVGKRACKLHLP
jgi:hypothetical protein